MNKNFSARLRAFEKRLLRDMQKRPGVRVHCIARPQARLDRWDAIALLLESGMTQREIAAFLGIKHVGNSIAAMAAPIRIGWAPRRRTCVRRVTRTK